MSAGELDDAMRVLLIGPPADRARLRAGLAPGIDVVGEVDSVAAARATAIEIDAWLIAPERRRGPTAGVVAIEPLTARETDVLRLLADGLSNKSIASKLGISDQTVKFHVAAICGKLSAANRTDAVRRAIKHGLVPL